MLSMMVSWEGVRERLEHLREGYVRGQAGGVFGAGGHHRFEILPPLSEADLAEADAQFGVQFLGDYRSFLSAGGAGPCYGLFPLAATRRGAGLGDGAGTTDVVALAADFDPGDISAALARLRAAQPPVGEEDAYQEWLKRYEGVLWDYQRTRGAACPCHEGCAYRDWLIISGPLRGQMWYDGRAGDVDLLPCTARDGSALTFGRWYLNWLDEAEDATFKTRHQS